MSDIAHSDVVIVVDDDPIARKVLAAMLRGCGARSILEADGGREALALLPRHPHAFVICDLSMPDMDGVEFVRALGARAPGVALLLVSGAETKVLTMVRSIASRAGLRVVGAAQKPIALERLHEALRVARVPLAAPAAAAVAVTADELRAALPTTQFELAYLPTVRLGDRAVVGFEALARWRHPEHGLLGPQHFIGLAERSGLIWELTTQVARRALAQTAAWHEDGLRASIALNISAVGEGAADFPDALLALVRAARLEPSGVTLELTETQVAADIDETLARLWLKGFTLAIDDFGVGNSGIEQLRRLPFAEFKIDRSLVQGAGDDASQHAILASSIDLGRRLGLSVVAEGVERREEWDELARLGCDRAQGYFVSPPLPAGQVAAWVERWTAHPLAAGARTTDIGKGAHPRSGAGS